MAVQIALESRHEDHAKLEAFDDEAARLIAEAGELFGSPRQFSALEDARPKFFDLTPRSIDQNADFISLIEQRA